MARVEHVAGPLIGDVQDCTRCGQVLVDNRGLAFGNQADLLDAGFPVGGAVIDESGQMTLKGCIVRPGIRSWDEMRIEQLIEAPPVRCADATEGKA